MSATTNDSGPAFPIPHTIADANDPFFKVGNSGMSLRDWFAGQALSGLTPVDGYVIDHKDTPRIIVDLAINAYQIADAMLAARNNQPEKP